MVTLNTPEGEVSFPLKSAGFVKLCDDEDLSAENKNKHRHRLADIYINIGGYRKNGYCIQQRIL